MIEEKDHYDYRCCVDLARDCVGAKCMAWTWKTTTRYEQTGSRSFPAIPIIVQSDTRGFCGRVK